MSEEYSIPKGARIGHVHLKVSDLKSSLEFYCDVLGFDLKMKYGEDAAFVAAGDYHHHIGLNTWQSKGGKPPERNTTGLFHVAIVYPTRRELAEIFKRLRSVHYPLTGASDHGVSEALYLNDPDDNGIELYWDKPREAWPKKADGTVDMYTKPLDLKDLLEELNVKR